MRGLPNSASFSQIFYKEVEKMTQAVLEPRVTKPAILRRDPEPLWLQRFGRPPSDYLTMGQGLEIASRSRMRLATLRELRSMPLSEGVVHSGLFAAYSDQEIRGPIRYKDPYTGITYEFNATGRFTGQAGLALLIPHSIDKNGNTNIVIEEEKQYLFSCDFENLRGEFESHGIELITSRKFHDEIVFIGKRGSQYVASIGLGNDKLDIHQTRDIYSGRLKRVVVSNDDDIVGIPFPGKSGFYLVEEEFGIATGEPVARGANTCKLLRADTWMGFVSAYSDAGGYTLSMFVRPSLTSMFVGLFEEASSQHARL